MALVQRWLVTLDGVEHRLTYTKRAFAKALCIEIDGETFSIPRGARDEPFRLGDEQAILRIGKDGKAALWLHGREVETIE